MTSFALHSTEDGSCNARSMSSSSGFDGTLERDGDADISSSVKVVVRVRPFSTNEGGYSQCIDAMKSTRSRNAYEKPDTVRIGGEVCVG